VPPTTDPADLVPSQPGRGAAGARAQVPAGRQRIILQLLRTRGSVSVADLEREFGISAMTARRDLRVLEDAGLAQRTYGGAIPPRVGSDRGLVRAADRPGCRGQDPARPGDARPGRGRRDRLRRLVDHRVLRAA